MAAACDVIYVTMVDMKTLNMVTQNWKYKGSSLYMPNIMSTW